jgi:hypothetical protein
MDTLDALIAECEYMDYSMRLNYQCASNEWYITLTSQGELSFIGRDRSCYKVALEDGLRKMKEWRANE